MIIKLDSAQPVEELVFVGALVSEFVQPGGVVSTIWIDRTVEWTFGNNPK